MVPHPLPEALKDGIARVARDFSLPDDWMNTQIAAQWQHGLPVFPPEETEWRRYGALEVGLAGRQALISLKLFAAGDQGPESVHYQDLVALEPSDAELDDARSWVITQDAGPEFAQLVDEAVTHVTTDTRRGRRHRH